MKFKENIKTGLKDIVDLPMLIIILIIGVLDLFFGYRQPGGYLFFFIYIFWCIYRIGFFKNALNKYVTKKEFRDALNLPKL